jgi:hypothetical protein
MLLFILFISLAQAHNCCAPKIKPKPRCQTKILYVNKVIEKPITITKEKIIVKKVPKKNRLSGLAGLGPTRLNISPTEAALERGVVGGVQYQRMLGDTFSIGVQVQSNESVLGIVGIDF